MLRNFGILLTTALLVSVTISTAQESESVGSASDHARAFITDSQSWEISGGGGGSSSGFGGASHGGARPQTAEIIKTFGERCPDVVTNNIQARADYVVVLDHEGGKGILRHRNKVAVFTRVTGDSIVSKSTMSLGGSVQEACEAIRKDWAKNSASIRSAEAAEAATKAPAATTPQIQTVAQTSTTKISVTSNPGAADIEVDGGFVGNTPSTIELASGDHTVTVTKNGYKPWKRKLKASGGNVNLNIELEAN